MKSFTKSVWAAAALSFSCSAWSGEVYVGSFLGSNPLQGLDLEINGQIVGTTNEAGSVTTTLGGGEHRLRMLKNNAALAEHRFTITAEENAEISISFADFSQPAEISFDKYDPANPGQGAIGVVEGYVATVDGYAISGATVRLAGTGAEVVTDDTGAFRLEVPRGVYTLQAEHPDYDAAELEKLRIIAGIGVGTTISLQAKAATLAFGDEAEAPVADAPADTGPPSSFKEDGVEEIVVLGTFKPRAKTTVDVERFSTAVTDAISIDELLRSGDSDVAAALKRIVGASIADGKYAVVRGLDGRYIAATLNGMLMPSTDPFRRDVQLDLFPSDILGGIEIQKSYSANLPGDTTGGIIRINTRGMPSEDVNNLSVSMGYITGVTGDSLIDYKGSDTDFLGVDDGLRELPGALDAASRGGLDLSICQIDGQTGCVSPQRAAQLAASLPNIYNTGTRTAAPEFDVGYTYGKLLTRDAGQLGFYGTASYATGSESRQDARINDLFQQSRYRSDQINRSINGYFVAGYQADAGWEVLAKTLLLRDTEDQAIVDAGLDKQEGNSFTDVTLEWVERQLIAQQFQGSNKFFDKKHQLDWRFGLSQSSRYSPDRRSYRYLGDNLAISTVERSYADLAEMGYDAGADYAIPFTLSDTIFSDLKFGVLAALRDREVDLVRIGVATGNNPIPLDTDLESLLTAENFANDAFRLRARSAATDSYDADQEAFAAYVSSETRFGERFTLVAGLRYDSYTVDLNFPNASDAKSSLESNEVLPALAATWQLREDLQLRFGYSSTVSRPNITELAPSRFFDQNDREFIGCPSCDSSTIDNLDIRAEYYFADDNSVSAALFYKDITDPLEVSVADGSGSASDALTFRNNEGAQLYGLELDSNLSVLREDAYKLSGGANLAFISSEIELDETGRRLEINPQRDLQGQSPLLGNLQFTLEHFATGQQFSLLGNYFGDRIDRVTRNQPSIEEKGRFSLNFNYEKKLGERAKLKARIKNLLDAKTQYTQGGKVIESYNKGVEFSLGYSHNF